MRNSISMLALLVTTAAAQDFRPDIPRTWDDQAVETFELPLAQRDRSPRYMKSAEYYTLTPRTFYRSYPMYAPGREPVGGHRRHLIGVSRCGPASNAKLRDLPWRSNKDN
jgi:hypothetical protein